MTLSQDLETTAGQLQMQSGTAANLEQRLDTALNMVGAEQTKSAALQAEVEDLRARLEVYEPPAPALIAGLLNRFKPPTAGVSGWNPEVSWSVIEPAPGAYNFKAIDDALAIDPRARLRVMAGIRSPEWLKTATGGAVTIVNARDGKTGTIARCWTDAFWGAHDALQAALAIHLDGEIAATFMTATMFTYGEPMLRQLVDPTTKANLLAAGWTPDLDRQAHYRMLDSYRVWKRTRIAIAANPLQTLSVTGAIVNDTAWTTDYLKELRSTFGPASIVGNNSIREEFIGRDKLVGNFYGALVTIGHPLSFQTGTWNEISVKGDAATTAERHDALVRTIQWAYSMGAHVVELPSGHTLTADEMAAFDTMLKGNAVVH